MPIRAVAGYSLMVAFTVVVFLLVCSQGSRLVAPPANPTEPAVAAARGSAYFLRVLVALPPIVVLGQVLARLLAYLRQPPVIGEVAAGILLGPSLLAPDVSALVLPPSVAPSLGVIAQLGVILY